VLVVAVVLLTTDQMALPLLVVLAVMVSHQTSQVVLSLVLVEVEVAEATTAVAVLGETAVAVVGQVRSQTLQRVQQTLAAVVVVVLQLAQEDSDLLVVLELLSFVIQIVLPSH
jgi:hypothetical protein